MTLMMILISTTLEATSGLYYGIKEAYCN